MFSNIQKKRHIQAPAPTGVASLKKSKNQAYLYYEKALANSENYKLASKTLSKAKKHILNAISIYRAHSFFLL